jgi:capsular polysaccharide biosynthesis protein
VALVTREGAEEARRRVERAEESLATGDVNRARELLIGLVGVIDAGSEPRSISRCVDIATYAEARDLALHFALCLWCARPGHPAGHRAVSGVALFHPDQRVSGAGYRVCLDRARASDWHAIATADPYAEWPKVSAVCGGGAGGPPQVSELRSADVMRPIGPEGTGAWVVKRARVTRRGKSLAIGVGDGVSDGWPAYVPGLGVWDPSAALRWDQPPAEAHGRLGVLVTRYSYGGYWHWLFEGLAHVVRLDDLGILASLDRLVICVDGTPPRFVHESLESVGIPTSVVTATSTPFDWVIDELVLPMRAPGFGGLVDETDAGSTLREVKVSNARYGNEPDMRAVRRRLGLDGSPGARGTRRLFVSRRDAATRRVVNEDALVSALRGLDFEVLAPGTLSFREQVAVFSEAEIVVGPHGAGLANALFMPKGSAMLELHHPDFGRLPYYERLAGTLGIHYRGLACEPAPTSRPDMIAAVDQATETIRTLLSQMAAP